MSSKKLIVLIVAVMCACALALFGCSSGSNSASSSASSVASASGSSSASSSDSSQPAEDITGLYVAQSLDGKSLEDYNKQTGVVTIESVTLEIRSDGTCTYSLTYVNGSPKLTELQYTYEDGLFKTEKTDELQSMEGTFSDGALSVDFIDEGKAIGTAEFVKQ